MTKMTSAQQSFVLEKNMAAAQHPLEVYHLSHDLRGPLNSILGFAELLLEELDGPLNETQKEDLAAIYQSSQKLLHLINTLVNLSKLEANRLTFTFASMNLNELVAGLLASDFMAGKPPELEIVLKTADALPPALGDPEWTQQVLTSMLLFTFRSQKKGRITMSTQTDTAGPLLQLNLEGVVLPAKDMAGLFDLMVHVDATGRGELGRGGLDLPLARRLVERQNGRLWAESSESAGTTFYFTLPFIAAPTPP
jgi:signal transduction histidine kinase